VHTHLVFIEIEGKKARFLFLPHAASLAMMACASAARFTPGALSLTSAQFIYQPIQIVTIAIARQRSCEMLSASANLRQRSRRRPLWLAYTVHQLTRLFVGYLPGSRAELVIPRRIRTHQDELRLPGGLGIDGIAGLLL
jgi:hypothetical protein